MVDQSIEFGAGAKGAVIHGDHNTVIIDNAKSKITIPALLPYFPDRDKQIKQINAILKSSKSKLPKLLVIHGGREDSPDTFAQRVGKQALEYHLKLNISHAPSATIQEYSTKEEMFRSWSLSLYNEICIQPSSSHQNEEYWQDDEQDNQLSLTDIWCGIRQTLNSNNESDAVLISTVIEKDEVIKLPEEYWQYWKNSVAEELNQTNTPFSTHLLVAICPSGSKWTSPLKYNSANNIGKILRQNTSELHIIPLNEFSDINFEDTSKWNDRYFTKWYQKEVANTVLANQVKNVKSNQTKNNNEVSSILAKFKDKLRTIYKRKKTLPMAILAEQLEHQIEELID